MDYKKLGKRIREERTKQGFTQVTLSEKIGISDTFLGAIERGEKIPSLETMVNVANALGVTLDFLIAEPLDASDQAILDQIRGVMDGQSLDRKRMAVEVIRTIFLQLNRTND